MQSQATISRALLDSRSLSEREPTFNEATANKFNDEEYISFSLSCWYFQNIKKMRIIIMLLNVF